MKTPANKLKVGMVIRFSNLGKPEWNINCNDKTQTITEIAENRFIVFDNGFVFDKYSKKDNFIGLYSRNGILELIVD